MKFCVECGCKLKGDEKICPECGYDLDRIKINRRSTDNVFFESAFIQSLSNQVDIFREDALNILREFDSSDLKKQIDDIDLGDITDQTLDQISDLKDETLSGSEINKILEKRTRDTKIALNRDQDYINNAKRKLKAIENHEKIDYEKTNLRIVELCDKSIRLNNTNPEAYYVKGQAYVNLKQYINAIDEFATSLALDEDNLKPRLAIANANRLNKDFDDAIDVYDSVLKIDSECFEAYEGKAITYYDSKDFTKADEFFTRANAMFELDKKSQKMWDDCKNN